MMFKMAFYDLYNDRMMTSWLIFLHECFSVLNHLCFINFCQLEPMLRSTGRPRAICGQRYPLPCFAWLWIGVRGSRAAAPKGTKSCRTQGDFRSSVRPSVHPSVRPSLIHNHAKQGNGYRRPHIALGRPVNLWHSIKWVIFKAFFGRFGFLASLRLQPLAAFLAKSIFIHYNWVNCIRD